MIHMQVESAVFLGYSVLVLAVGWVIHALWMRSVAAEAYRMQKVTAGAKGTQRAREYEDRLTEAMAYVMTEVKNGKSPADALKLAVGQYPDVAARLATKMMQGKLPAQLKGLMGGENDE